MMLECYSVSCNTRIVFIIVIFIIWDINVATVLKEFDCSCINSFLEETFMVITRLLYRGH